MNPSRRDLIRGAAALVATALPARAALAAAAGGARRQGLIVLSADGVTVSTYLLDKAQVARRPADKSGFDWLTPKRIGAPLTVAETPLGAAADAGGANDTAEIIARQVARLRAEQGLGRNITIVASSDIASLPAPVVGMLRARVKARTGLDMGVVSATQEGRLAFDWIVPAARRDSVLLIDIGDGETRAGFHDGARYRDLSVPRGTRTMAGAVKLRWPDVRTDDFGARSAEYFSDVVAPLLRPQLAALPETMRKPEVYLTGDIAWAMATIVHPAEMAAGRDRVPLTPRDFSTLRDYVAAGTPYGPGLPSDLPADGKARIRRTLSEIRDTYNPHQIAAGAGLGEGLSRQFAFDRRRQILFPRFARDGWSTQYLAERLGS